jgi:2',3'-cyclic-nucleotide 2'-phosphodiesterase (5'-nucleotidase family)
MTKLKNYVALFQHFVIFLTILLFIACVQQKMFVTKIEGKEIGITDKNKEIPAIEEFIKPYRENIDKDLNAILAYAPQTIDKTGEWQTNIGNLLADVTLQKSNLIFNSREKKNIDICLLNHGGIRSIISKGNVTARTAYEIMPFENSAVIVALKSDQITEIANYIITEKKPHPLSGLTFTIGKDKIAKNLVVNGKPLDNEKTYYVVTSDYLANGGDNMTFLKKGINTYTIDYKLRNVLIDYFKEVDTIPVITDKRISVE